MTFFLSVWPGRAVAATRLVRAAVAAFATGIGAGARGLPGRLARRSRGCYRVDRGRIDETGRVATLQGRLKSSAIGKVRTAALLAVLVWEAGVPGVPARAAGEMGEQRAREAAAALHRGQAERATQLYTEALADTGLANNRRAAILNDRGVAFARINQARPAIDDFNRAAQLSPETASIYNNRGNVLLALGFVREAVKDFDRALLLAPGYAAAYANRATALARLGENDAAIRDYSQAIRLAPGNPAALNGRGRLHLAQSRPHAAMRDFGRAIAADARFAAAYRGRADAKIALARFNEAIEDLSRAVAFEANNVEIYVQRGYAYLAAGNVASAIKDFARAGEINARSGAAAEGLALANAKAEAYDEALNEIARALEIDPRSAQAYAYRAVIYKWMGQRDVAARDLERAMKLEPARPEVLWAKAELAEPQSNTAELIQDLRKALAARPLLREAAAALDRLGAAAGEETDVRELFFERWRVYRQNGVYYAASPELPKLAVPLEVMGDGMPRILGWDTKNVPIPGFGLLTFQAGQVEGANGPEEVVHAAVIDLAARSVVAIEPTRQGSRIATWTWEETTLLVKSVDGHTEEYVLRSRPKEMAQPSAGQPPRRVTSERPTGLFGAPPSWAPWAWGSGTAGGGSSGSNRPRPQQQPKSLFDLLFKN